MGQGRLLTTHRQLHPRSNSIAGTIAVSACDMFDAMIGDNELGDRIPI